MYVFIESDDFAEVPPPKYFRLKPGGEVRLKYACIIKLDEIVKDAAGAILYAAEKATWMTLEAIQCLGGNGYINDYATGRLLRDAKLYEIGAGPSEIRRMLIGRELFRETA